MLESVTISAEESIRAGVHDRACILNNHMFNVSSHLLLSSEYH
jgi:hypothetical protein